MKIYYLKEGEKTTWAPKTTSHSGPHRSIFPAVYHIIIPELEIHAFGIQWYKEKSGLMHADWHLALAKFRRVPKGAVEVDINEEDLKRLVEAYKSWEEEYESYKIQAADESNWRKEGPFGPGIFTREFKGKYNVEKYEKRFAKIADKVVTELEQRL